MAFFKAVMAVSCTVLVSAVGITGKPTLQSAPQSTTARRRAKPAQGRPAQDDPRLAPIATAVEEAIRAGKTPGAVVLIGHDDRVIYRRAFGLRSLVPRPVPESPDTIFDIASLTKVVATTTAIMQLVERGEIRLEDPVVKYWPEFGANGKDQITVRELMTHYSGLPPDLDLKPAWSGYETAMRMIVAVSPTVPPGTRFVYSDINFETLGELVRRVSGQPLDVYTRVHIFSPLGMDTTLFRPPPSLRPRIAPTQYQFGNHGPLLWGEVHDPTAYNMGGVAGHAGLFSTADDLARFAQMLLDGGTLNGARILSPGSVLKMTTPQNPVDALALRGLGWDIDSPFSSNRGGLFPVGSFGHTGYTGTSLWIDPFSRTYVILLTNSVHPKGEGNVLPLRAEVATITAAAFARQPEFTELAARLSSTGYWELMYSYRAGQAHHASVETGIDVLEAQNFAPLAGLRVGVITNQTGCDLAGRRTIDLVAHAPQVKLVAVFSPEHGLSGTADTRVSSGTDASTGVPVYSLYGESERPTDRMLEGVDALVYDIQDAGVRFYTYETTLGYMIEAAARRRIPIFVLDRPNPLTGVAVEGPVLDPDQVSFVGYHPLPVRHGLTVGELARLFNSERRLGADLRVIRMKGWDRAAWFDETGLAWINPSPNLRDMTEATLYPGVALIEGTNVSVGRGTDRPFELLGAPWIDGARLARYLESRHIQGVRFVATDFTPSASRFSGELCHGVAISLIDRMALDSPELGIELAAALLKLFPEQFQLDKALPLVGSRSVLESIKGGSDPRRIAYVWKQGGLTDFRKIRSKYLLY
jgi:uncharacterized protein YbbC (DUF1343 family)/CubicO group peptidase (beta-lactamase class C family)